MAVPDVVEDADPWFEPWKAFEASWKSATPTEQELARLLVEAFNEADPNSFIQGDPAIEAVTIDGHFNLIKIVRRITGLMESKAHSGLPA